MGQFCRLMIVSLRIGVLFLFEAQSIITQKIMVNSCLRSGTSSSTSIQYLCLRSPRHSDVKPISRESRFGNFDSALRAILEASVIG